MIAFQMWQRPPTQGRLGSGLRSLLNGFAIDEERDEVPDRVPVEAGILLVHNSGDSEMRIRQCGASGRKRDKRTRLS